MYQKKLDKLPLHMGDAVLNVLARYFNGRTEEERKVSLQNAFSRDLENVSPTLKDGAPIISSSSPVPSHGTSFVRYAKRVKLFHEESNSVARADSEMSDNTTNTDSGSDSDPEIMSAVVINRPLHKWPACTQLLHAYLMKYIKDEFKEEVHSMIDTSNSSDRDYDFADVVNRNSSLPDRWTDQPGVQEGNSDSNVFEILLYMVEKGWKRSRKELEDKKHLFSKSKNLASFLRQVNRWAKDRLFSVETAIQTCSWFSCE